jgi:hypothetical protein
MRIKACLLAATLVCTACDRQEAEGDRPAAMPDHTVATPEQTEPGAPMPDTSAQPAMRASPGDAERGDTSSQGIVRIVGADPFAQPVIQSGSGAAMQSVGIQGALRAEIEALSGVEVRVWGRAVPNRPPPPTRAIEVSRYEVVSVNGRKPYVGELAEHDGAMWLQAEREMRLASVPDGLANRAGAKVWIVGSVKDDELSVEAFGVIKLP